MAFPLVGKWLSWITRNGRIVKVVIDPWEGSDGAFMLNEGLLEI